MPKYLFYRKNILSIAIVLLVLWFIVALAMLLYRIGITNELIRNSEIFEQGSVNASAKILIVGDSIALGVGAATSTESISGLLATDNKQFSIATIARSGARIADIEKTLERIEEDQFDIVVLMVGTSDVIRFTKLSTLETQIQNMLERAQNIGISAIWMPQGNLGNMPFFPFPINYIYTARSKRFRDIGMRIADDLGVSYVDLYHKKDADPLLIGDRDLFSRDRLHPNSDGYRILYETLKSALVEE